MPASPMTVTRLGLRSLTTPSKMRRRTADSWTRPTMGTASRMRSPGLVRALIASHPRTGALLPFATSGSTSRYSTRPRVARKVSSPTRMPPVGAAVCRRDAVLTTSPATIASPISALAPSETIASPVLTATLTCRSSWGSAAFITATALWTASAARTPRSGSSPCATGAPKTAITASPMNFSTVPPNASISARRREWYWLRRARTSSGSRRSARAVNPSRSANSHRADGRRHCRSGHRPGCPARSSNKGSRREAYVHRRSHSRSPDLSTATRSVGNATPLVTGNASQRHSRLGSPIIPRDPRQHPGGPLSARAEGRGPHRRPARGEPRTLRRPQCQHRPPHPRHPELRRGLHPFSADGRASVDRVRCRSAWTERPADPVRRTEMSLFGDRQPHAACAMAAAAALGSTASRRRTLTPRSPPTVPAFAVP